MGTDLQIYAPIPSPVSLPAPPPAPARAAPHQELLDHWLSGRSPRTVRAYRSDLSDFAAHRAAPSLAAAVAELLALGPGPANAAVLGYRADLERRGLATATVARRLAALRSLVELAGTLGLVTWEIGIRSPRIEARRDVRGPDQADRKKLWKTLKARGDGTAARRDRALVALLFDLALRRAEVVSLDLADLDLAVGTVQVQGKGKREKSRLTLPAPTRTALREWVEVRGEGPGPLFLRLDRARGEGGSDNRLTGDGVAAIVRGLGVSAGLPRRLRPHGFRHSAITAALDSGRDIREVRKFSRHAKLETVIRYDDAREDTAGEIARRVSRERK